MRTHSAILVMLLSFMLMLPVSGAATSTVVLHAHHDYADVSMQVNSTLNISWTGPSLVNLDQFNVSSSFNFTANATQTEALNSSLSSLQSGLNVSDMNVSFAYNLSADTQARNIHERFSLNLTMKVSGIFHGDVANMTWRSFNYRGNMTGDGINVNGIGTDASIFTSMSPSFLNFSSFAVPLTGWNGSYIPSINETIYEMSSTYEINSTSHSGLVNFSLVIDPEYTIVAPGYDTAHSNSITIGNPPSSHGEEYYLVAAVVLIIAFGSFYYSRRKR